MTLRRWLADPFILLLLATVLLASLAPCRGAGASFFHALTVLAIALMFFLYGLRLSGAAILAGMLHWRLHVVILLCTFVLYPLLALLLERLLPWLLPAAAWSGIVFLSVLPSTVQSSVAFTAMAGGNVTGAVCSATLSNLLGTVLTPLLVALLFRSRGPGVSTHEIAQILTQLLLPFIVGQICRPWLSSWARRHMGLLAYTDRGAILLVVYSAFSAAVIAGLWHQLSLLRFGALLALEVVLLATVVWASAYGSRLLGFERADRITIVLCGSKKSLATGIPMANVLFAGPDLGMTVIPVMLFHQLQLMVASALAQRYARDGRARPQAGAAAGSAGSADTADTAGTADSSALPE
jgi:sodium/bile acid cotransporter 7